MPSKDYFVRLLTDFGEHLAAAEETAKCEAEAERLLAKAEYELGQARRQLLDVLEYTQAPKPDASGADASAAKPAPARPGGAEAA